MGKTYKLRSECSVRELGEEGLLYDAHNKKVHVLNETGSIILSMIQNGKSIEDIASHLSEKYNVDIEEIKEDITSFIKQFEEIDIFC